MGEEKKICVGVISGAHGVQGHVKIRSFTEVAETLKRLKPITDEEGSRIFVLKFVKTTNDYLVAALDGITTRDQAEGLRNTELFVGRASLPKLKRSQFYEADLVSLKSFYADGKEAGRIIAVHNYGGGPFLEIEPEDKNAFMLPFTKDCVKDINFEEGRVTIMPPEGWIETASLKSPKKKPAEETE